MTLFNTLLVVLILFISGCGSTPPTPLKKKTPPPSWVNGILPDNTNEKLYGLGRGKNRESAINNALNSMVSTLGVSIESSLHSNETVEYSYVSSRVTNDIKINVAQTNINNYKVIKSYKISYNDYAVMVETDTMKFLDGLKETLEVKKDSIQQRVKALKFEDTLTRYNRKKLLAKEAENLLSTIFMIAQLDSTFNKTVYLNFVSSIKKDFLNESNNLKFYIIGDSKSKKFVIKVKNILAKSGFNIANNKSAAVKVRITTEDNITGSSIQIAVLNIKISVYDKGKLIGGKSLIMKERYRTLASIYKNAAIHFEEDIKEKGINQILGINLDLDTNY